jgi:hypothetical protein
LKNFKCPDEVNMKVYLFLLVLTSSGVASAQEFYPFFRDVRQEAMGGAAAAVVDDQTALFINPSGLGKIRGSYFTPVNLMLDTNVNTFNAATQTGSTLGLFTNPQTMLAAAQSSPYNHMHAEAQTLPSFVTTNFGIGLYSKYQMDSVLNPASNQFTLNYFNDDGAVIGYCFRLFDGRLKLGASGKVINRVYVNQVLPGTSSNLSFSQLAEEGTGAGWDASAMLTGPWAWLPTATVVAHDVGNTYFNLGNGIFYKTGVKPPQQEQVVNGALAIFPIHGNRVRSSFTVEWQDIANSYTDVWRSVHGGWELNISDIYFLRAGVNEHYWTAGLEIDFGHAQLQLASYGEDIGTNTNPQEDRRYVAMYGIRF